MILAAGIAAGCVEPRRSIPMLIRLRCTSSLPIRRSCSTKKAERLSSP